MADEKQRKNRILKVFHSISQVFSNGYSINYESLIGEVMFNYGTSRRTSIEYIQSALSQIPHKFKKLEGEKHILADEMDNPSEKQKTLLIGA